MLAGRSYDVSREWQEPLGYVLRGNVDVEGEGEVWLSDENVVSKAKVVGQPTGTVSALYGRRRGRYGCR